MRAGCSSSPCGWSMGPTCARLSTAEGRLDPLRAARIVRQVGAALDAAHARGMLHRDIKPSNVLLGRRGPRLPDRLRPRQAVSSVAELTRGQTIVARAEYVAPEQILNQRVDARADIYALGCLLFEALTGETPFARWRVARERWHTSTPRGRLRATSARTFRGSSTRSAAGDGDGSGRPLSRPRAILAGGAGRRRRAATHQSRSVVATGEAAPPSGQKATETAPAGQAGPETARRASARRSAGRSRSSA